MSDHGSDQALAESVLRGDEQALQVFETLVRDACGRSMRSFTESERDEVRQRILVRLLSPLDGEGARLQQYRGKASLSRWLRVIIAREAQALRGNAGVSVPMTDAMDFPALVLQADLAIANQELRVAFKDAFQSSFAGLSLHERVVLRQHFHDGINISGLAKLHQVHRNTMARELAQTRERLFNAVCGALSLALQISGEELQGLLQPADLDVSLSRLFRELPADGAEGDR